jgi:hypothetical protein
VQARAAGARPVAGQTAEAGRRSGVQRGFVRPSAAPLSAARKGWARNRAAGAGGARRQEAGPAQLVGWRREPAAVASQTPEGAEKEAAAGRASSGPRLAEPLGERAATTTPPPTALSSRPGIGRWRQQARGLQPPARQARQQGTPAAAGPGRRPNAPPWPPATKAGGRTCYC